MTLAPTLIMYASSFVAAVWVVLAFRVRDTYVALGAMFVALGLFLVAGSYSRASHPGWEEASILFCGVLVLAGTWHERERAGSRPEYRDVRSGPVQG